MSSSLPVRAFGLGVVTGLRSQLPLALLARTSAGRRASRAEHLLRSPAGRRLTGLVAGGEIAADKLPSTPPRLHPPVLASRLALGGLSAALLARGGVRERVPAMALGTAGAALGTAVGYTARTRLPARTGLPDAVWAVLEDGLAYGLGRRLVRQRRPWPLRLIPGLR